MALLLLLGWRSGEGAELLQAVRFAGNDTTRPEVMLQEMTIHAGDPVDAKRIEESRQAIMNLGLFKDVRAELLPEQPGPVLLITVEEKYYVLPIPRIGVNGDGATDYGMELRLDNFRGLNERLKFVVLTTDDPGSTVPLQRSASFDYDVPRLAGTPYQFGFGAEVLREDLAPTDGGAPIAAYTHEGHRFHATVSRWLQAAGPSRGFRYGTTLGLRDEAYTYHWGTPDYYLGGRDVNLSGFVEYTAVEEDRYRRKGGVYGYVLSLGVPEWGDFSYVNHLFYYRRYIPLDAERANLDYRFQLGMDHGEAYAMPAYSLGGPTSLRGYAPDTYTGNAMVLNNFEYLFPFSGYPEVRGMAFLDFGNVYPNIKRIDLTDMHTGTGLGVRWRVPWFVNVTARIDVAWGLDTGTRFTYVGTTSTF